MRDRLREHGVDVVLVDAGVIGEPLVEPDIGARRGRGRGRARTSVRCAAAGDRGAAVAAMARGAAAIVRRLHAEGRLDGILALGGTGGTSIVTPRCGRCRSASPS